MTAPVGAALDATMRAEHGRCLATLVRILGDIDLAEDALAEAAARALERWPRDGIPDRPGAWLTTVARRHAIDRLRRETRGRELRDQLAREPTPPTRDAYEDVVEPVGREERQSTPSARSRGGGRDPAGADRGRRGTSSGHAR